MRTSVSGVSTLHLQLHLHVQGCAPRIRASRAAWLLLLLLAVSLLSVSGQDICSMLNGADSGDIGPNFDLDHIVHQGSMPRLGKQAGTFTKVPEYTRLDECISTCCAQGEDDDMGSHRPSSSSSSSSSLPCHVVFLFNETCYLISCDVTKVNGCEPITRPNLQSTMVMVRTPVYKAAVSTTPLSNTLSPPLSPAHYDEDKGHPHHASSSSSWSAESCEYGLKQCGENERCVVEGARTRAGLCQCLPGLTRDGEGVCKREAQLSSGGGSGEEGASTTTTEPDSRQEEDNQGDTDKTTAKPATPQVTMLTVSAGENKVLQLPENSITLSAFVLPKAKQDEEYHYEWSPLGQPQGSEERATMQGKNTNTLKLSNLIAGLYQMKVQVTGDNKFGQAMVNITVLAPKRQNKPPVAIITPASQQVKSENSFILDGSDSTDDDGITAYHWEEVNAPLQVHQIDGDTQTLKLKDMAPGFYVFRLTVTDTDGLTNSTSANVTVIKETDYPPKANAGSDVIIHLPTKSVTLCGNASTDDKGIASYEWIKKSDSLTADMTGVRTVCLQLNNLELGDYTFTLKVTDTGGNTNMADVHVYVKPETNQPPVAHTAGEITVMLPSESLVLDGKSSTDDKGVTGYKWTQTGGPSTLTLTGADQAVAQATGEISEGDYEFKLTVTDEEGQSASDKLTAHVKMSQNQPPKAHAGGNRVVMLPVAMVTLDGSKSSDDRGIVSYLWERDLSSLAAGDVVNNSDHSAVLRLVRLVAGRYSFKLTVTDQQGLTSSDTASLQVKNGENYKDLVEMVLDTDIHHFSQDDKANIIKQLELLIHQSSQHSGTVVDIMSTQLELTQGQLRLTFMVKRRDGGTVKGVDVVSLLHNKLDDDLILSYPIVYLDTVLCQNNCSGHGTCDQRTRTCHCEAFWMPNIFTATRSKHRSNCEWSILYVVIICFIIIVSTIVGVWGVICCCRSKRCRFKTKKRHRYSLLREMEDDEDKTKLELMPKNKIQNSSVMISESDFSSEEETLFVNSKPVNGHSKPPNGVVGRQQYRTKLKA